MNTTKPDPQNVFLTAEWRSLAMLNCGVAALCGEDFRAFFKRPPASAFLVAGSDVKVYRGVKLTA